MGTPKANVMRTLREGVFRQIPRFPATRLPTKACRKVIDMKIQGSARFAVLWLLATLCPLAVAQSHTTPDPKSVPVVDGGIGPCSADFTVNDANNAPVYAAKIIVHIAYGFMNVRKLDLEVGTNAEGKARFTGLPNRVKQGLYFHASEGDREGEAFDDPASNCKAQFTITLRKKSQ